MITEIIRDQLQASALIKELIDQRVQFSYIYDDHEHVISYHPGPNEETAGDVA